MTIHRFKLKDLDIRFLQQLQAEHQDDNMEITFWLKPKAASGVSSALTEEQFWELIEKLDWEKTGDNEAVIEPLVAYMSTLSKEIIQKFDDILSEKLYLLDGKKYAQHIGEKAYGKGEYFSVDAFLYARCCVVANGKDYYYQVLEQPSEMPKNLTFSPLLRVASEAWKRKTEEKYQYVPSHIYETFANSAAWDGEGLMEQILDL